MVRFVALTVLSLGLLLAPLTAGTQPAGKVPRIGFLGVGGQRYPFSARSYLVGLGRFGYLEGEPQPFKLVINRASRES